ncbi:hypothetical protein BC936DRAFT_138163 [Jimgerdemannia flammicorona]|uniref:3-hydroxyacyl-CoA dehydrogenase n=1 Tax=Jimgerdemannia flammicorona TaxID=994334 RepID=A0A433CVJ8_9FUNG|nr:hypothetical protein BC936DRAFT_138163 [Jimgerdemannia flammicorona]
MRIKGNTFVVTGGASGMGEATVHELVRLGANVAIFDIQGEKVAALAKTLGDQAFNPGVVDVTSEQQVKSAIEATVARFGKLAGAINCGGILTIGKIINPENPDAALNLADLEDVLRVNVIGTLNVCKQVANVLAGQEPYNKDGERGVLINTTSVAWDDGQVGQVAYAAAKGGIYSVSLPMARDLAPYGVRVMAIAPGCFQTPMVAAAKELPNFTLAEMAAASSGLVFPKRFGQAPEFAQLVVQIVENVMLNGSVIRLDGGVRLK